MGSRVTQPSLAPADPPAGLLSVEQVAKAIRRHPEVVRRQAREGRLPGEKIGRGWFFRPHRLVEAGYRQFESAVAASSPAPPGEATSESFLMALSEAGLEALQLVEPGAVFQAVGRRLAGAGLGSFFFLVTDDGGGLRMVHANRGTADAEAEAEKITPNQVGQIIPFDRVPNLKLACETRRPQFLGDPEILIARTAGVIGHDPEAHRKARRLAEVTGMRAAISAPLITGGRVLGAITVIGPDLRESHVPAVMAFANQTAAAAEAARLIRQSRESEEAMVQTLAMAIEMRASLRNRRSDLAVLAQRLAERVGLDANAQRRVRYTALLQDLGKIGMPDAVLKKQRRLDSEERAVLMTHPALAADMLEQFGPLAELAPLVHAHHEWFNGGGYPDGLKGDAIPLETRIVSVINAFSSVTFERPTRTPDVLEDAKAEVRTFSAAQLDPAVVDAFVSLLEEGRQQDAAWFASLRGLLGEGAATGTSVELGQHDTLSAADSRELRIIYRIAQETSAVLELDVLLARIVGVIRDVMGYSYVSLLLPDPTGALRAGAFSDYESEDDVRAPIPPGKGITGWAYTHGIPQIVPDTTLDPRYLGFDPRIRSELAFPLINRGRILGVLNVESETVNAFGEADLALMSAIGSQLAAYLEVAQMHDNLKREAIHDSLTRLYNRRLFQERLNQEIVRARSTGEAFSIVFLDVDQLKRVNDTYGHLAGDALLREVANALTDAVRGEDTVARYAGDEFVVLLHSTPAAAATVVAHRIREGIARHRFMAAGHLLTIPGVSIGVASFPTHGGTAEDLLAAADADLYAQKRKPAS